MRRLIQRLLSSVLGLLILIGIPCCIFETEGPAKLAGTSISTGNPGIVRLDFVENGVHIRFENKFTGKIEVYGSTQIPILEFGPAPLFTGQFSEDSNYILFPGDLHRLADSAWPAGSKIGDSIRNFNLLISNGEYVAFIENLLYRKHDGCILSVKNPINSCLAETDNIQLGMIKLVSATAFLDIKPLKSDADHYLFIPGSPFVAPVSAEGTCAFTAIPQGIHDLSFISVVRGDRNTTLADSIDIYRMRGPIYTNRSDTLEVTSIDWTRPLPESLKR